MFSNLRRKLPCQVYRMKKAQTSYGILNQLPYISASQEGKQDVVACTPHEYDRIYYVPPTSMATGGKGRQKHTF